MFVIWMRIGPGFASLNPFEFRADVCRRPHEGLSFSNVLIPLNSGLMFVQSSFWMAFEQGLNPFEFRADVCLNRWSALVTFSS